MAAPPSSPNYAFASDNTAGICPEAWAALAEANTGRASSYGADRWTAEATVLFQRLFETECDVYFVFNGTASNALALAACCRSPHTRILCHEISHVDTDECGAPEFFTGGAKVIPLPGANGKLQPNELERAMHRGHGVHYPKPGAISLTQATEWGTIYRAEEVKSLTAVARAHGLPVHMDGARFANAVASIAASRAASSSASSIAADLTWRAGVDVLSFGGTKNGMLSTEAVVFFNRDLAKEFEYRVKQGGQLASKMRFAAAQWVGMLRDGTWLRHAAHANAMARSLAEALREFPLLKLTVESEVNGVFVDMPPRLYTALGARGWAFYRFIGDHGYRLMCSWSTTPDDINAFVGDVRLVLASGVSEKI